MIPAMPPTAIVRQNGAAIRVIREIRGLTVNQLAERVGLTPRALRYIEAEQNRLPKVRVASFCDALGIDDPLAIIRDRVEDRADAA